VLDLSPHCRCELVMRLYMEEPNREGVTILVKANRINQYTTKTGQKTGRSNMENHEQTNPMATAFVAEYQNLNSGSRLTNGRNSSSCFVGRALEPPSSMFSSCSMEGSNLGDIKARKRLRR